MPISSLSLSADDLPTGLRDGHQFYFPLINTHYSQIPKNASSTMLATFLSAQGVMFLEQDVHTAAAPFSCEVSDIPDDAISVLVLRDPVERMISAYFDKVVWCREPFAVELCALAHQVCGSVAEAPTAGCSFSMFIRTLAALEHDALDAHWCPQASFLIPRDYRYACLMSTMNGAQLSSVIDLLEGLELPIKEVNTRASRNARSRLTVFDKAENLSHAPAAFWREWLSNPLPIPGPEHFQSDDLDELLAGSFSSDANLLARISAQMSS